MLHVHRSASADALVSGLADVLADPAPGADPFTPDLLAVGARGTERWIAQRLSHRLGAGGSDPAGLADGICARVDFVSPDDLLDGVLAEVVQRTAPEHADAVARWSPQTLTWHVLEVLDELVPTASTASPAPAAEDAFAVLRHHLRTPAGEQTPRVRRTAVASRLAGLFARYGAARPQLLVEWAAGRDGSAVEELPADLRWQPEVFRRVREHVGLPAPAELLDEVCARLRAEPGLSSAPPRLGVFVVTRLAVSRLRLLAALAEHREVHVFLQHPGPALWSATEGLVERSTAGGSTGEGSTGEGSTGEGSTGGGAAVAGDRRADWEAAADAVVAHPLLLSLSRDVRELQVRLAQAAPAARHVLHPAPAPPPTLLGRLQASLADGVPLTARALGREDRSVQVHSCHGRVRQVEVLREVVLGLLDEDPTLQPRDVVVMCPDVEAYAPLVSAVFSTDSHPGGQLRVAVADRSAVATNPLLGLAARLLELAQGRITATDVLDLAAAEPVRRRFSFDDEELEQVREWTVDAGVHWGLGPQHRAGWQLGDLAQGSWRAGLDRLLVGVALGGQGDELLGGLGAGPGGDLGPGAVVPLADVESSRVDLAGRLAELVDRLEAAVSALAGRRSAAAWCEVLLEAVLDLADVAPDTDWQLTQLRGELGEVHADAVRAGRAEVGLADVAALVAERFAGRPQRSNFRTGAMTVCTLSPMRSVPHRVVCLLGMDDGAFPRTTGPDADDLLARAPRLGDRDPRSEDRQVLLDAISCARQHLVVTYGGRDVRTGSPLPPAVPVAELLDALDGGIDGDIDGGARDRVVVQHPLQPSDPKNFTAAALGRRGSFSYDTSAHAGALATREGPVAPPPFLPAGLPPAGAGDVDLEKLVAFFQHPARGFLRQRLEIASATRAEEPDDALPVELDGLQEWAVGDRCLTARLAGVDAATISRIEAARGDLPPGVLAQALLRKVGGRVDAIATVAEEFDTRPPQTVDVELDLAVPGVGDVRLTGSVRGVRPVRPGGLAAGEVAVTTTYSRVRAKQTLRAWVELLAVSAARPGEELRAVVVGRAERGDGVGVLTLGPVPAGQARGILVDLLGLRDLGLRFPLPLPVDATAAWAKAAWSGRRPELCTRSAREAWTSEHSFDKEDKQEENVSVWGGVVGVDAVLGWRPPPGAPERTPGSFGELARRLWEPLLGVHRLDVR